MTTNYSAQIVKCDQNLTVGMELNVTISGVSMGMKSELVGISENEYFIIKPPNPLSVSKNKLYAGNGIVIRYLDSGTVNAFQSRVIDFISKPVNLVFIEYPREFVQRNIRNYKRLECMIPVTTVINGLDHDGVIVDINQNGCRCVITLLDGEKRFFIKKDKVVKLWTKFLGTEEEAEISGLVKNTEKRGTKITLGLQFLDLSRELKGAIMRYTALMDGITT